MVIDVKDVIIEKGNWIGYKTTFQTNPNFAVSRKETATNRLVPKAFPKIDLHYETDVKALVELLARLEKLAVASLKQIKKESHALRATELAEEIQTREARRLAEIAKPAISRTGVEAP